MKCFLEKKSVNSFIKSTITLLFYLFEKYDTVAPRLSLVLLRRPHILFSSYFFCNYLQSIELKLFKPTLHVLDSLSFIWRGLATYMVSLPLYWELGDDKRDSLWKHLTFNTFVPSIFMTSVHPPPPHASSPCLVMWQYTGIFADPTSSKYALFSLDLLKHSTLLITPSLFVCFC